MNSINNIIHSKYDFWTKFDYAFYADILGVYYDIKKIAKLEPFTENNIKPILIFLDELWLKYIKIKRAEVFNEKDMIFNKATEVEDWIDLFVSKLDKYLDLVAKIYNSPKSKKTEVLIWKLLWYPDCCIKSFLSNKYINDKLYDNYLNDKTIWYFDWRLNNTLSIYRLIPFFPCTYNCNEAIKYAQKQFDIMPNNHNLYKILRSLVLYDNFWNYIVLIWWKINNKSIIYDSIFSSEYIEDRTAIKHIEEKKYIIKWDIVLIWKKNYRIFDFTSEVNI